MERKKVVGKLKLYFGDKEEEKLERILEAEGKYYKLVEYKEYEDKSILDKFLNLCFTIKRFKKYKRDGYQVIVIDSFFDFEYFNYKPGIGTAPKVKIIRVELDKGIGFIVLEGNKGKYVYGLGDVMPEVQPKGE